MNINPNYEDQNVPSSSEMIEGIQGLIYDMLIKPMQKELSLKDIEVLGKVADIMQRVGEKATAYEELNEPTLGTNYRN